ncbi:MAG: zinc ABC transporter substrate-binding protein [Thermoleophilaceae bacterium]|nr:zinc ABC transporter substrate-binding protein [Thermoleophilaceae bacterium]
MRARLGLSLLAILVLTAAAGCGDDGAGGSGSASLTAVATTTQVGDFVRQVGGERVEVQQILEPNADPHDYEPRPSDVAALEQAAAVFRSGGDLEEWLDELIDSAGGEAKPIALIDSVRTIGGEGEVDPHWWQDPGNAESAVNAIRDALAQADPGGRDTYRRNAAAYVLRLRRLDRDVAGCIERVPPRQRKLVTTHDALGYYAERYGLEVVGALIPSLSSQAQPSSKDTADLVGQIERLGVRAIFPESSLNPKLERAVARETGAEVGDALWADTLGPKGSSGATYLDSIQANTDAIVRGLTGGEANCRV